MCAIQWLHRFNGRNDMRDQRRAVQKMLTLVDSTESPPLPASEYRHRDRSIAHCPRFAQRLPRLAFRIRRCRLRFCPSVSTFFLSA